MKKNRRIVLWACPAPIFLDRQATKKYWLGRAIQYSAALRSLSCFGKANLSTAKAVKIYPSRNTTQSHLEPCPEPVEGLSRNLRILSEHASSAYASDIIETSLTMTVVRRVTNH